MGQLGFFDAEKRLAALSEKGDPLEAIAALVPWELGMAADRLRRRGIPAQALLAIAALLSVAAQFALILSWPLPTYLSWSIVTAIGAATVLSFAALAELCLPQKLDPYVLVMQSTQKHREQDFAIAYAVKQRSAAALKALGF